MKKKQGESKDKLESLEHTLDIEKKRSEEYLTRLKYVQADFENLKKRFERQMQEVKQYCSEQLMIELLEVVDELEMAVNSSLSVSSTDALVQGVEMTLKKLKKIFDKEEVRPIDCVGQMFDPKKHEAIAKTEDDEDGRIVEEMRRGYIMKGKVIRPSIVKITAKPSSKSTQEVKLGEQ